LNLAYWEDKYYFEDNDLIIVGAGIVGLTTAISAKRLRPELKILVLERSSLPSGASTKNAGFACFGSVTELLSDQSTTTEQEQIDLIKMRWDGLELLKSNVTKDKLLYRARGGVEVLDPDQASQMEAINHIDHYNGLVEQAIGLSNCFRLIDQDLSSSFHHKAIYNQYEGELNPMHMMSSLHQTAIKLGVNILYGLTVDEIDSGSVKIEDRHIQAKYIAVCTNGLTRSLFPNMELKAVRNQVFVTDIIEDNPLSSCYHFDEGYIYFREIDGRILIGGARNQFADQETTDAFGQTDNLRGYLKDFLESKILNHEINIAYEWSGILGVGTQKSPIIEQVKPGVYVGVRLGGMGVAIGSRVGDRLARLIYDPVD